MGIFASWGLGLSGDFSGNRDAGIVFRFRFGPGSSYFYLVEQPGNWRHAHRGSFEVGNARDPKYKNRTLTIVRFTPGLVDVPLLDRHGRADLEERALLADREEEYLVSKSLVDDQWRANVKHVHFYFTRPDLRNRLMSPGWSITQDSD